MIPREIFLGADEQRQRTVHARYGATVVNGHFYLWCFNGLD